MHKVCSWQITVPLVRVGCEEGLAAVITQTEIPPPPPKKEPERDRRPLVGPSDCCNQTHSANGNTFLQAIYRTLIAWNDFLSEVSVNGS